MSELEPLQLDTQCYCTSFQLANYVSKLYRIVDVSWIQDIIKKYIRQEGNVLNYNILKHQVDAHEIAELLGVFANVVDLMEKDCLPKQFIVIL